MEAVIRYAAAADNENIWSNVAGNKIYAEFNQKFESGWFPLVSVAGDFIENATDHVLGQDSGFVKIFVKI